MSAPQEAVAPCACGTPSEAAVLLQGVIGRGSLSTGTETEELIEYRCARHVPTRYIYNAMLRRTRTDEHTAFYGPWQCLEFEVRILREEKA